MSSNFLPVTREDMLERGWDTLDFLFISGDAYVDHPSFGHAILTRVLEREGYKVGIIPQPDWKTNTDFTRLGRPKLAVLISSGVIDSMVVHYTANKKRRSTDSYSPGGRNDLRPDRALIVYVNRVREVFKGIPVIIGGIEASLRRFAHYDYWSDDVRRSILQDTKADLMIYGMGEKPLIEVARLLKAGCSIDEIRNVRGTAYLAGKMRLPSYIKESLGLYTAAGSTDVDIGINQLNMPIQGHPGVVIIPSFSDISENKRLYAEAFMKQSEEQDALSGSIIVQPHDDRYLVQNPPIYPLSVSEMDKVYALPYERTYHPMYEKDGGIPAIKEVEFSITSHRGCLGGCSFCALNFHQGRIISQRSSESIVEEAQILTRLPSFKGYIHDVGGPTANFMNAGCEKQKKTGACKEKQCLFPTPCANLKVEHREYLELLRRLRKLPGIKKVFIRSGIRYDYLMLDKNDDFFTELCEHHISGQLKVAPEHIVDRVLKMMGKPERSIYEKFVEKFNKINKKLGKEQYLVPYLISSHPGSDLKAAVELAEYMNEKGFSPEQVQDFYPTPGTLSTCMYYTGLDPRTMKPVHVPDSPHEKAMQRALLQYRMKENYSLVLEALKLTGREDLIGWDRKCLIRPHEYQNAINSGKRPKRFSSTSS